MFAVALIAVSCTVLGWLDDATGDELRIFLRCFWSVAMSAWRFGQEPACAVAIGCASRRFGTRMAASMTILPQPLPRGTALV